MSDLTVDVQTFKPADRPWLEFEADGTTGPVSRTNGLIDFSSFTAGTHYPDGFLPSGMALVWNTAGTRLVRPGSTNAGTAAYGLLYNGVQVPADTSRKIGVAIVDCFAVVRLAKLPANSGVDTTVRTALPLIKFRA